MLAVVNILQIIVYIVRNITSGNSSTFSEGLSPYVSSVPGIEASLVSLPPQRIRLYAYCRKLKKSVVGVACNGITFTLNVMKIDVLV